MCHTYSVEPAAVEKRAQVEPACLTLYQLSGHGLHGWQLAAGAGHMINGAIGALDSRQPAVAFVN